MFFSTLFAIAIALSNANGTTSQTYQHLALQSTPPKSDFALNACFKANIRHLTNSIQNQEPAADPDLLRVIARLEQFELEEQKDMVNSVIQTMLVAQHPQFSTLQNLREQIEKKKFKTLKKNAPRHYKSSEFAPALRLRTRIVEATSSRGKSHAKKYRNQLDPISTVETWQWSYGQQSFLKPSKETTPSEMVRQMWQGKWPNSDQIAAEITALLDNESNKTALADYFEHSYRDRDGRVYSGFTLEQMWASGTTFGISDVETIAFLRTVLKDDSMQSPINKRLHSGLYALIKDAYLEFREYKQLRQALAVRFANPHGKVPAILASTSERFDLAWALCEYQPDKMRHFLSINSTRKEFFTAVTAWEKQPGIAPEELKNRIELFKAFPIAISAAAKEALRREGLMGLRGR